MAAAFAELQRLIAGTVSQQSVAAPGRVGALTEQLNDAFVSIVSEEWRLLC